MKSPLRSWSVAKWQGYMSVVIQLGQPVIIQWTAVVLIPSWSRGLDSQSQNI